MTLVFQGFQFVNSSDGIYFDQSAQQCLPCKQQQYILDSNNPAITCQDCPIGAVCDGSSLKGLVAGSNWVPDWSLGVFVLKSCPAGYVFHNTSSDSAVFNSLYQECEPCSPSFYCLGGTSQALACPTGTYSYQESTAISSCITVSFVSLTVSLQMSKSDFNIDKQNEFKATLASSCGTTVDHVVITSIIGSRRAAESSSLNVVSNIATNNETAAAALVNHFDINSFVNSLAVAGFPSAVVQSIQVVQSSSRSEEDLKLIAAISGSVGAAALFTIVLGILWVIHNAPASKRLLSARYGQPADQRDLPKELRKKYEAVQVVGSGAYGVVIEAWQVSSGKRTVRRAVKLVHARGRKFTSQELRRLDREVIFAYLTSLWPLYFY